MTQGYIQGELSAILGQAGAACPALSRRVFALRRRVEAAPLCSLPHLAADAMDVLDAACWALLEEGDLQGFLVEAGNEVYLQQFARCAGLLP